ncbi:hypothetical protein AAVH_03409 [Aphelenchoides avenae]|nr:hypothetical protein AAVH_03409 [Aphelenchus avenae]
MSVQGLDYHAKGLGKPEKFDVSAILSKNYPKGNGSGKKETDYYVEEEASYDGEQAPNEGNNREASRKQSSSSPDFVATKPDETHETEEQSTGKDEKHLEKNLPEKTDEEGNEAREAKDPLVMFENVDAKFTDTPTPQDEPETKEGGMDKSQPDPKERGPNETYKGEIDPERESDVNSSDIMPAADDVARTTSRSATETDQDEEADSEDDGRTNTGDESEESDLDSSQEPSEEPALDDVTSDNADSSEPESGVDSSGQEPSDTEAETDNDDNEGSADNVNEASDESTEEPISSQE